MSEERKSEVRSQEEVSALHPSEPLALPVSSWRVSSPEASLWKILREASDAELIELLEGQERFRDTLWPTCAIWEGSGADIQLVGYRFNAGSPVRYLSRDEASEMRDTVDRILHHLKGEIIERFRDGIRKRRIAAHQAALTRRYNRQRKTTKLAA